MIDNTKTVKKHNFDEDGSCYHCGFDGAEWQHWKNSTYEGRASDAIRPECIERKLNLIPEGTEFSMLIDGVWKRIEKEAK